MSCPRSLLLVRDALACAAALADELPSQEATSPKPRTRVDPQHYSGSFFPRGGFKPPPKFGVRARTHMGDEPRTHHALNHCPPHQSKSHRARERAGRGRGAACLLCRRRSRRTRVDESRTGQAEGGGGRLATVTAQRRPLPPGGSEGSGSSNDDTDKDSGMTRPPLSSPPRWVSVQEEEGERAREVVAGSGVNAPTSTFAGASMWDEWDKGGRGDRAGVDSHVARGRGQSVHRVGTGLGFGCGCLGFGGTAARPIEAAAAAGYRSPHHFTSLDCLANCDAHRIESNTPLYPGAAGAAATRGSSRR